MKTKIIFIILFVFSLSINSFSREVISKEDKSFKLKYGSTITVIADDGFIKVNSWDKEEVRLKMTKRAWAKSKRIATEKLKRIEIDIDQSENRLYIQQLKFCY